MIKTYKKKPVVIQAIKFKDSSDIEVIKTFCGSACEYEFSDTAWEAGAGIPFEAFTIHTLEGDMTARRGDYIIKGVNGEFYPCKADIFKKTYEEV